jgi:hypothetical protein
LALACFSSGKSSSLICNSSFSTFSASSSPSVFFGS